MLTGDPAAETLMSRMDIIETANRNLTGEVERLRFERDNLRAEVVALAEDIRVIQEQAAKFNIHLDAVELVAKQSGGARTYAPRTYGGDTFNAPGPPSYSSSNQPSFNGPTQPTYNSPNQPSALPSGPPSYGTANIPAQENFNDISGLPSEGRTKLAEGDFSGAQSLFQQYLTLSPDAPDAGEVSFWLGETFFVKGGYADAADAYITSMRKDRDGVKAPDAMIRLAASLRELGNKAQACQTLDSFTSQYPNASEALRNKRAVELGRTGC